MSMRLNLLKRAGHFSMLRHVTDHPCPNAHFKTVRVRKYSNEVIAERSKHKDHQVIYQVSAVVVV